MHGIPNGIHYFSGCCLLLIRNSYGISYCVNCENCKMNMRFFTQAIKTIIYGNNKTPKQSIIKGGVLKKKPKKAAGLTRKAAFKV